MRKNTALKYILCLALGISALLWGCSPPQPLDSVEGKFTVVFPAGCSAPKKTNQLVNSDIGDINVTLYNSENADGACTAAFNDYPESFMETADPQTLLDNSRNGMVQQVNGIMEKEEPYSIGDYPGRKIYYRADYFGHKMYGVQILLLAGNRLYQIGYVGATKDKANSPEVQGYLNSFKLTGLEAK